MQSDITIQCIHELTDVCQCDHWSPLNATLTTSVVIDRPVLLYDGAYKLVRDIVNAIESCANKSRTHCTEATLKLARTVQAAHS